MTIPGDPPITTTVLPLSPETQTTPAGNDFRRADVRRGFAIRRDEVATAPRGTIIETTDDGAQWKVDATEMTTDEEIRVWVLPYAG